MVRGNDKNAYLWNLQGEGLNTVTLLDALPHCKDPSSATSKDFDLTRVRRGPGHHLCALERKQKLTTL